jgi:sulfide:quinone oxidoreductase
MKTRILILGAGFGGLELSTSLSEAMGESIDITLIDKSDGFVFGYSKLDLLFGRTPEAMIRNPYSAYAKPGVRLLRENITAIDVAAKRVTTDHAVHEADILVIALGADYDVSSTPGIVLGVNEFYSVAGAAHLAKVLPGFQGGDVVVGVCGAPYKCPPAPAECALMMHDYMKARGLDDATRITLVSPLPSPVPPSPDTSKAILHGARDHLHSRHARDGRGGEDGGAGQWRGIAMRSVLRRSEEPRGRCGGGRRAHGRRLGSGRSIYAADQA